MSVKRLGKGLEALIRSGEDKEKNNPSLLKTETESISTIKLKHIYPNPEQPRKHFDAAALNELAASISENGLISPITVRKVKNGYELIAGERRWRALKYLKKRAVPAYVVKTKNSSDVMEMALVENIQREDLNAIEESEAYSVLNEKYGLPHEAIAKAVGKKRATISNSLRLLKLPLEIRRSLIKGKISAGHARAILQTKPPLSMIKVWKTIVEKNLSVRNAENMVKTLEVDHLQKKRRSRNRNHQTAPIENKLIEILGTKVKLKSSKNGGKIEISYFSIDDLERIIDIISS
ncbi:MAG: hypothetical protein CBE24_00235 [bacterium TMED264]|nr:MAG: hypothetical protein CBE24_00235 [bacterium TMED264]